MKKYLADILIFGSYIIFGLLFFSSAFIPISIVLFIVYLLMIKYFSRDNVKIGSWFYLYSAMVSGFKGYGKDASVQRSIISQFKRKFNKQLKQIEKMTINDIIELAKDYDYTLKDLVNYLYDFYKINLNEVIDLEDLDIKIKLYFFIKPNYISNLDYGYGARLINLKEFKLFKDLEATQELDYKAMIEDVSVINANKIKSFEGVNLYISDAQVYFPASQHSELAKKYPSFPIFIQLARQLYNMNIIINTQVITLVWDKLRDQQDISYVAKGTFPKNKSLLSKISDYLPFFRKYLILKGLVYTKVASADEGLLPFQPSPGIKDRAMIKAERERYEAEHGVIKKVRLLVKRKDFRYDSRAFHPIVFKQKAPK